MSVADALAHAGAKPAGRRPYFMAQEVERVLAITMAVAQELAVARERIDTLERLLDAQGTLPRAAIEAFAPDPSAAAERGLWMQEYLARILRIVQQEGEAIGAAAAGDPAPEDVATELANDQLAADQRAGAGLAGTAVA